MVFNIKGFISFQILVGISLFLMSSCSPVFMTAEVSGPPPPWFYPNRLEIVRYVYFPEYHFYYDLSARRYLYLEGGVWVRRRVLPPSYRNLDLRHSRYERVRGYRGDHIGRYHERYSRNRGRTDRANRRGRRSNM